MCWPGRYFLHVLSLFLQGRDNSGCILGFSCRVVIVVGLLMLVFLAFHLDSSRLSLPFAVGTKLEARPRPRAQWHKPITLASDRVVNVRSLLRTKQSLMEHHLRVLPTSNLISTLHHIRTPHLEDVEEIARSRIHFPFTFFLCSSLLQQPCLLSYLSLACSTSHVYPLRPRNADKTRCSRLEGCWIVSRRCFFSQNRVSVMRC
jgi:hypothetical protein